ncbi:Copper-transporting ATPase HMA4 [Linum perenne]
MIVHEHFYKKDAGLLVKLLVVILMGSCCSAFITCLGWFIAREIGMCPRQWMPEAMDKFKLAIQFGTSVLVIACPCALGLATAIVVLVATRKCASQGVLKKSGDALEKARQDRGNQQANSEHPIAKAVRIGSNTDLHIPRSLLVVTDPVKPEAQRVVSFLCSVGIISIMGSTGETVEQGKTHHQLQILLPSTYDAQAHFTFFPGST